ncbi:hypothetical protein HK101_010079 [Irineochytrium annulatum]|nr:hypothetical protein HK101_010079 [Irineochytrium annulatum]
MKSKGKKKEAFSTTAPERGPAASAAAEIDDIFSVPRKRKQPGAVSSSASTSKPLATTAASSSAAVAAPGAPAKSKKKRKIQQQALSNVSSLPVSNGVSSSAVETVDHSNLKQVEERGKAQAKDAQRRKAADDDGFGDSRGAKTTRTTDDGMPLYDVKDLKIGEGNGGIILLLIYRRWL